MLRAVGVALLAASGLWAQYSPPLNAQSGAAGTCAALAGDVTGTCAATVVSSTAATVRIGAADASAAIASILKVQGVVAGTTNTAGAAFTIKGSAGTGTGAGGAIILQTAPAGLTGTTQNALVTALTINSAGTINAVSSITAGTDLVALGTMYVERANGLIFISGSTATQRARIQSDSNNALNFKVGAGSVSSMYMANTGAVSMGNGNTGNLTGTFSALDTTATTGATLSCFGYDCSGTFTGTHTSATTSRVMVVAGQAQSTTHLQDWTNNAGTSLSFVASDGTFQAAGYKSSDGTAGVTVTTCTGFKNGLCISGA